MNWMFTDMDSYFASVEQYLRPELRGRPVGIIPVKTDSTCLIAASYDAKRLGAKVGTGVREARQLCPEIMLVVARPQIYVQVHQRLLQSVDHCAPVHRVYSIDEWAVRLQGEEQQPAQAQILAQAVKKRILDDFGPWMTCSIGIAPTRLLAKIASDLQKPNGLTVLSVADMPNRLENLSPGDLCGIGAGMRARLDQHGIRTIRELWDINQEQAIRIWGSVTGAQWWAGFHGQDEPEQPTTRRSMSQGNVLAPRFRHQEGACCIMARLVCKLGQRLRQSGYLAKSLRISVRDERGGSATQEIGLLCIDDTPTLLQQFYVLWQRLPAVAYPIKKVDVCVAGLIPVSQAPRSLFDEIEKLRRLSQTIDEINQRWGSLAVYFGPVHCYRQPMDDKIAFGRIPE